MAILPIDLQTLFTSMGQVGKDQAVQKDGAAIQQGMQGLVNIKNLEQKDNSVNQSKDIGNGLEKVKDEQKKSPQGEKREKEEKEKEEKDREESKKYFTDPDCGHHIDITR